VANKKVKVKIQKGDMSLQQTVGLPVLESAGGLVCNRSHHILLMFKRGKWDMPKGRVEEGQSRKAEALREVHEETGLEISKLSLLGTLVPTWHTTSQMTIPVRRLRRGLSNVDGCTSAIFHIIASYSSRALTTWSISGKKLWLMCHGTDAIDESLSRLIRVFSQDTRVGCFNHYQVFIYVSGG